MSRSEPVLVTVLRHGNVEGPSGVLRGSCDAALSEEGMMQMNRILAKLESESFDLVATSPLRRCRDFAVDYAGRIGLPLQVVPDFREIDFGLWEGLMPGGAACPADEYRAFMDGRHAPPLGESISKLRTRVSKGWAEWMAESAGANRLLVTHAGVMRALLMELFGFTPKQTFRIALPEAACLRISHLDGQTPFLLSLN